RPRSSRHHNVVGRLKPRTVLVKPPDSESFRPPNNDGSRSRSRNAAIGMTGGRGQIVWRPLSKTDQFIAYIFSARKRIPLS
ncbi:MAG: hypothetical protein NTW75_00010, partial [Planctomycetales bacterium]|nr:hypothetical protein [Planctomycetales bacterium]